MSRLQVFPPVVTLYPSDRQTFTAQSVAPPAMWDSVTLSGDIQSDFSLQVDAAQDSTVGSGAHQLFSGLGIVEWTIDDQMRPTSAGGFNFTGIINDIVAFQYQYQVKIAPTTIQVFNELNALLITIPYSTVSADIYRLELSSGFRLFRNGVLLHERVNLPTQVVYPMSYVAQIIETTATAPSRILPPRLIGDWRLAPLVVDWVAPSHGSITTLGPALKTEYFGGTIPGRYSLVARIEAAADALGVQLAAATIDIPPLFILGNLTELTLKPVEVVLLKTNYDVAQNPLVTWSIVSGGGSFSGSEFTAPQSPGTTIVRATSGNQIANLTITIPATITTEITAAAPDDVVEFASNLTDPIWTATSGLINNAGLWRVPTGTGRKVRITATAGASSATKDIEIVEKFPRTDFKLPWAIDFGDRELVSEAEDGSRTSRTKSEAKRSFPVELLVDAVADLNGAGLSTIRSFWERHSSSTKFILEDPEEGISLVVYRDSALRWEHAGAGINIAFRVKEA